MKLFKWMSVYFSISHFISYLYMPILFIFLIFWSSIFWKLLYIFLSTILYVFSRKYLFCFSDNNIEKFFVRYILFCYHDNKNWISMEYIIYIRSEWDSKLYYLCNKWFLWWKIWWKQQCINIDVCNIIFFYLPICNKILAVSYVILHKVFIKCTLGVWYFFFA